MSRESEAGEIVSCELLVSGCDVSPILQLGDYAFDDVSALLGGVITRVWRAPAQVDLTRLWTSRRQLITRLFVDPGYQLAASLPDSGSMAGSMRSPCRRFACALASANARLGADVDRYSFIASDFAPITPCRSPGAQNPSAPPLSPRNRRDFLRHRIGPSWEDKLARPDRFRFELRNLAADIATQLNIGVASVYRVLAARRAAPRHSKRRSKQQ